MVLKTFNIDATTHAQFAAFCRAHGMSMSKQIQMFMQSVISDEPNVKEAYQKKLERIKKGKFFRVENFAARYGLEE
jgi:antitoxin component of RelBE/YafQ-DinJ toxin-antitoxin module